MDPKVNFNKKHNAIFQGRIEKMGTYNELQEELSTLSKEIEQQHQVHAAEEKLVREQTPKVEDRERGLSLALQSIASLAVSDFSRQILFFMHFF